MNVRGIIGEIHERVEREERHPSAGSYSTLESGLDSLRSAYGRLYEIRNLVGQMPPSPDTKRARIGAFLVKLVQRMLFWYTPQIARFHNQTTQVIGALCDVVARQNCRIAELEGELKLLRSEVASRPRAGIVHVPKDDSHSSAFQFTLQDHFRGTEGETSEKLSHWLDAIENTERQGGRNGVWLDIGCGRGEWLAIATAPGREVLGIDSSTLSVERCSAKNLRAEVADAVAYLRALPDESIAVITAFQVIEHLPMDYLQTLVALSARKLRSGGVLVVETPDPANLQMAAHHFWNDPTHQKPVPSDLMEFMFRYFGLTPVRKLRLNPFPQNEHLTYTELDPVRQVDQIFYGPRDYGLIGRRDS